MKVRISETETIEAELVEANLDESEFFVNGKRFTEADAEAASRELSRRHGRLGGRPRLSSDRSTRLGVILPLALRQQLKAVADSSGLSESALARDAIEEYLSKAA